MMWTKACAAGLGGFGALHASGQLGLDCSAPTIAVPASCGITSKSFTSKLTKHDERANLCPREIDMGFKFDEATGSGYGRLDHHLRLR